VLLFTCYALPVVLSPVAADDSVVKNQNVPLYVGDTLSIRSDRDSIQTVFIAGNLSYVHIINPPRYPGDVFALSTVSPGQYDISATFRYDTDYTVHVYALLSDNTEKQLAAYYLTSGVFTLNLAVTFTAKPVAQQSLTSSISPWGSFASWMSKFSEAFPFWVKILYFVFVSQFALVGGLWVRRESIRREGTPRSLDRGNKFFLWVDVIYKCFATSFVAIVAVMVGELFLLFVLRFMFLASLDLLSLWDLFVVGFAGGMAIIAYAIRFFLEKGLDFKPLEEE